METLKSIFPTLQIFLFDLADLSDTQMCVPRTTCVHIHLTVIVCANGCYIRVDFTTALSLMCWNDQCVCVQVSCQERPDSRFWCQDAVHAARLEVYVFMKYKTNKISALFYMKKQLLRANRQGECRPR